ncbi:Hvo_1808 family surface protein [Natrialbaceae archaeon A-gly3]
MTDLRTVVLTVLVVTSLVAGPSIVVGGVTGVPGNASELGANDRATPTTEDTIGYVDGYWYDEALPVDDRDDAVVDEDELEAVVSRSMARVEVLRDLPFEEDVSVDVISRQEFQAMTANADEGADDRETDAESLEETVHFEALFMVDRNSTVDEAFSSLLGDAVEGFYSHETNEVVLISDAPETPELDEVTLAHELLHALQDQHFGLDRYETETQNEEHAKDGLIEGDAVWIETAYEQRCEEEWDCVIPTDGEDSETDESDDIHWGLYLVLFHPYSDGPSFVEHLRERGGWNAVNDAYDDPPTSSSEVIRPESYGDGDRPDVTVTDRSTDRWQVLETGDETSDAEFGEAAMAAMFAYPTLDDRAEAIVPSEDLITGDDFDPLNYDHEFTRGWVGDSLVVYVTDERTPEESGYVWQTEWENEADADAFVDGYLGLLAAHDALAVEERQSTFVIEDGFPGAYYLDRDGDTVTVVRAPTVSDLEEIREGTAPETTARTTHGDEQASKLVEEPASETELSSYPISTSLAAVVFALLLHTVFTRILIDRL